MTDILKGSWVGIAGLIYAGVMSMGCTTGADSEEMVGEVAALGGGRSPAPPPPSRSVGRGGPPRVHSHGRPGRHHVEGQVTSTGRLPLALQTGADLFELVDGVVHPDPTVGVPSGPT